MKYFRKIYVTFGRLWEFCLMGEDLQTFSAQ